MAEPDWAAMHAQHQLNKKKRKPCASCLRQLVTQELYEYCSENRPRRNEDALSACYRITQILTGKLPRMRIGCNRVKRCIHAMRLDYVNFRKFMLMPGVVFFREYNYVTVKEEYFRLHQPIETAKEREWREEGCDDFNALHFIFRKRKFPMFESEPQEAYVDPFLYSDSSSDGGEDDDD